MNDISAPFDQDFVAKYPVVHFHKGEVLIKYGQLNHYLYMVKDGICACTMINTEGNTHIPLFLHKNEVIGIRLELLDVKENRSIHEVTAHTEVNAYKIPLEDIRHLLKTDFAAYRKATMSVISSLDRVLETSNLRGRGNTVMMVCNTIYRHMEMVKGSFDVFELPDYLTVTDLANSMLVHRITVSRIMHSLCDEGVMEKIGNRWLIRDAARLNKYRQGMLTLTIRK